MTLCFSLRVGAYPRVGVQGGAQPELPTTLAEDSRVGVWGGAMAEDSASLNTLSTQSSNSRL